MVAEGLGDDRGGHFQDVLADSAGPASGGGDAEVADEHGQTSQVVKRRMSWACSGSVISARWPASHRSNEQICLSTAGSTPQAIRSSRRWEAARQGWRPWNASWVSAISPWPSRRSRSSGEPGCPLRAHSQVSPDSGWSMVSRKPASGASSGRIWPVPSSSNWVRREAKAQRVQRRPPWSLSSSPHREQANDCENPAQVAQIAIPSPGRRPGSARSLPQPGQTPRQRTAWSAQVRQTNPSGQLPALCLRRPQRQHSATYQRSYCSSVA